MSIRGRLDQLQGRANHLMSKAEWTLEDAKEAIRLFVEAIGMVTDGVGFGMYVEKDAARKFSRLMMGGSGEVPIRLVVDLDYAEYPPIDKPLSFVDGPFDGMKFKLTESAEKSKTITLDGAKLDPPVYNTNFVYLWSGHEFVFDRDVPEKGDEVV